MADTTRSTVKRPRQGMKPHSLTAEVRSAKPSVKEALFTGQTQGRFFRLARVSPLAVLSVLLAISLGMMTAATQNSALFGDLYSLLLVLNILGVALLLTLILLSVRKLVRQFRARVMGSRLTLRLFGLFVLLSVVPVAVVYLFSVQAFNRGIDNWFDVRIEQALDSALALGRTALDTAKEDLTRKARDMARGAGRQFAARAAADAQCVARTARRVRAHALQPGRQGRVVQHPGRGARQECCTRPAGRGGIHAGTPR